jgi:hypothetical protein
MRRFLAALALSRCIEDDYPWSTKSRITREMSTAKRARGSGPGVGGSNPLAPTTSKFLPVIGLRYLFQRGL